VLRDVPTAFQVVGQNSNIYGNTMIGLSLLRRFNVIFDYFKERIILEPSESFGDGFTKANVHGTARVQKRNRRDGNDASGLIY